MGNIKAFAVIGSGYGDEGKGLMTDYFCRKNYTYNNSVLNVKVNGGAQAGHTVCAIDNMSYYRCVFHSIGSGTFAGADTHLGQKFIVDSKKIVEEIDMIKKFFVIDVKLSIDPNCRLTFSSDIAFNQFLEEIRDKPHGSCGYGVFETVNRSHFGYGYSINDFMEKFISLYGGFKYDESDFENNEDIINEVHKLSQSYLDERVHQIMENEMEKESELYNRFLCHIEELYNKLWVYAEEDVKNIISLIHKRVKIDSLNNILKSGDYRTVVFECSQGLELDWSDKRNFPHVTASHTGLRNIAKELANVDTKSWTSFEVCYVSRSYKTKHGDGDFPEYDPFIYEKHALYDRTNISNKYQGALRFGKIDTARLKEVISQDLTLMPKLSCDIFKTFAVTHIDQTDESILTTDGDIHFSQFNSGKIMDGDGTYFAFGEKSTDIIYDIC